ncbi:MAG: ABC transporter ATP-binding protein [Fibrobacterota bacterium]
MNNLSDETVLEARGLRKSYFESSEELKVLDGVDLTVRKGAASVITGVSGAGKTTLLNILGALERPDEGSVKYFSEFELRSASEEKLDKFRNENIGFVFQFHHLLPEFTALENVMMPGLIAGGSGEQLEKKAMDLLEKVGLSGRSGHVPSKLSGGERQRAAVARSLFNSPAAVLADEPTGNLDSKNSAMLYELMQELNRSTGVSFIIVSHDEKALEISKDHFHLEEGKII